MKVPVGALDFTVLTSLSLEFNGITVIVPQAFQVTSFEKSVIQTLFFPGSAQSAVPVHDWQQVPFMAT